jgi:hypothetical protein
MAYLTFPWIYFRSAKTLVNPGILINNEYAPKGSLWFMAIFLLIELCRGAQVSSASRRIANGFSNGINKKKTI